MDLHTNEDGAVASLAGPKQKCCGFFRYVLAPRCIKTSKQAIRLRSHVQRLIISKF